MTQTLLWIVVLGLIFYFMLIRPAQKSARKQMDLQSALAEGDRVMLTAGIIGMLRHLGDKQAVIELAPGVDVTVVRGALARKVPAEEEEFEYSDEIDETPGSITLPAVAEVTEPPTDVVAPVEPVGVQDKEN